MFILLQVLELCFKLYSYREPSVHSTAGVAIRQIATALFERLSVSGEVETASEGEGVSGEGEEKGKLKEQRMSQEAGDAYLLFQVYT